MMVNILVETDSLQIWFIVMKSIKWEENKNYRHSQLIGFPHERGIGGEEQCEIPNADEGVSPHV